MLKPKGKKEKTTLYTRAKIITKLEDIVPRVVDIILKTYDTMKKRTPGEYESKISFGEYASPSFDAVVETVGKAKMNGVMSIEQCVEELYGDTWTDEEKAEEVQRIKEQSGMIQAEEPKVVNNADLIGGNNGQEG